MTSNMDYRLLLIKNADTIIANNQNIAIGNCSNIISISENKPLVQNPYLIQDVTDNYLPFENSDLKDNYLNKYVYAASKFTPIINLNNRN
ncbi:hypothetical protein ceV_331 [Chrysochromulina ericina virus CeV-01B]|jgi:hypothetical protein|uniref:Uncharacterized protein n=1 Tax=Chrysochromulina ericina virus CeV-01B TaxID=3070830 RepID=A0A0N9R3Y5_9VIRU|nr:hypothetical protein ceV_331 [Chrysochromulina ericina virus]ALH23237.1 hypothetical protein ceV_331 [Chrysochromulina ericina virus CeV-01B]|tara:strand:+ start:1536 stop:1805 length:270 start_codon:yes stop_codon:yes gene_type:complete